MTGGFLVDESLSPTLVDIAIEHGHFATSVQFRGLAGRRDWDLMPLIRDENFILVTNNAKDFRVLYSREEFHSGLVLILPVVNQLGQRRLFATALAAIGELPDLINLCHSVDIAGHITIEPLAASGT